jgi:hypothetical protein
MDWLRKSLEGVLLFIIQERLKYLRNRLTVPTTRRTAPTEPVRQLIRVTLHLFAQLDQVESMALFVPGKLANQVVGTGGGIGAEEGDNLRLVAQFRLQSMLPIPNR